MDNREEEMMRLKHIGIVIGRAPVGDLGRAKVWPPAKKGAKTAGTAPSRPIIVNHSQRGRNTASFTKDSRNSFRHPRESCAFILGRDLMHFFMDSHRESKDSCEEAVSDD